MQTPILKDFYESELKIGDRVAFNFSGGVRQGIIKSIKKGKTRPDRHWQESREFWKIEIEHLFNGGISVVKNLDGICKIKIDLE